MDFGNILKNDMPNWVANCSGRSTMSAFWAFQKEREWIKLCCCCWNEKCNEMYRTNFGVIKKCQANFRSSDAQKL